MKIVKILVWQVDLPVAEGRYTWSSGNFVEVFDSTIVQIQTDVGISGFGECCPLGSTYLPSYANGVRAGVTEIAPHLIGADPRNLNSINCLMDGALLGHPYAKAPLDVACWDILSKSANLPLYTLLGGAMQDEVELYRAISQETSQQMAQKVTTYRQQGYRKFQLKVGGSPNQDIDRIFQTRDVLDNSDVLVADANTGWTQHEAARVVDAVSELDVYIEQPCRTYNECLSIRHRTAKPFILDEVIGSVGDLQQGLQDDAMDIINLKISKVGGLTKAKIMRDLCVASGIPMTIEDTWGGDITTAAIAHLAQSTPKDFCFSATDFNSYVTVSVAAGAPSRVNGKLTAANRPGLGIEPRFEILGNPVLQFM